MQVGKKYGLVILCMLIILSMGIWVHTTSIAYATEDNEYELIIEDNVVTGYTGTPISVVIPEGVTSIGADAFRGCSSLSEITIPEEVTSIGNYAFGAWVYRLHYMII